MNHIVALPPVIDRAVHVGFLEVFETSLISLLIGYHQKAILTHSLSMDLRTHVTMVTQTRHSRDMSERSYSGSDTTKWSPELWTSPTCKWTVCLFWSFRTRLDALIASTLSNGIDLNKVLTQFCSSDADLNDWTVKQQAVRNLCDTFSSWKNTCLWTKTNRSLKKWRNFAKRMPNSKHQTSREGAQPMGSTPTSKRGNLRWWTCSLFSKNSGYRCFIWKSRTKLFDEFRRPAEKPAFFGTHPPEGYGRAKVDQRIKKNVPKAKQSEVKTTFSALKAECDSLVVGGKPNLEAILTDWGLTSQILNKASVDSQIRLLAAVQHIKNWLAGDTNSVGPTNEDGQLWAFHEFKQTYLVSLQKICRRPLLKGCQWIPYILKFSVSFNWHVQQRLMWIQSQWTMTHFLLMASTHKLRRLLSSFRVMSVPQQFSWGWWNTTREWSTVDIVGAEISTLGVSTEHSVFDHEQSRIR